jgi:hypothetical protein
MEDTLHAQSLLQVSLISFTSFCLTRSFSSPPCCSSCCCSCCLSLFTPQEFITLASLIFCRSGLGKKDSNGPSPPSSPPWLRPIQLLTPHSLYLLFCCCSSGSSRSISCVSLRAASLVCPLCLTKPDSNSRFVPAHQPCHITAPLPAVGVTHL